MERIEKTVFLSYRHHDDAWALAVFLDLHSHGYDVFIDYDGLASGDFETAILENIRARAHFLVLLTPTALKRRTDPTDWVRREIEAAVDSRRNIVPIMLAGFDFGAPAIAAKLSVKLAVLKQKNGIKIPEARFFSTEMERLRTKFLNAPVDAVLHPASQPAQRLAKEQKVKATSNTRVPWTDEQWTLANQVTQEEANRIRVAAKFLKRVGLPRPDAYEAIDDTTASHLATLEVQVPASAAEMADPEAALRSAAALLARLEDAVVFRGLASVPEAPGGFVPPAGISGLRPVWKITGAQTAEGLWSLTAPRAWIPVSANPSDRRGNAIVRAVSEAIGRLEHNGHFGPFAVVLGQELFLIAQTPDVGSPVMPQDRILSLLGGGPLLRSSTFDAFNGYSGVVVALGGATIELIVSCDVSLQVLQLTSEAGFALRLYEKIALRIAEPRAIAQLYMQQ